MDEQKAPKKDPSPQEHDPRSALRPLIYTLILFSIYFILTQYMGEAPEDISYTEFKSQIAAGRVAEITIQNDSVTGKYVTDQVEQVGDGNFPRADFKTVLPAIEDPDLWPLLVEADVKVTAKPLESPVWVQIIISLIPWILIFALFFYSSRAMRGAMGGRGGLFDFSRSKARRFEKESIHIGYDDVAGVDSAKQDLQEVIDFLRHPEKYRKIGAKMPKGILMMGPPGTGKTLLAKATAGEANVPFFSISGSEFIEMFVGVGASRVRDMFTEARKVAPSLIFIDEIDSVGRVRGTGMGGGNDEREQTLNQVLAEMDGFTAEEAVVVLAATNRPDVLDPALLRPGRFDRKIVLELPQREARKKILEVHTKQVPLSNSDFLDDIAARTVGFSGADLANLVNEAALTAARDNRDQVTPDDFEIARDKVILGAKREQIMNEEERRRVAYHEAGHAVVAAYAANSDPLRKVSIIPRGRALGMTEQMPMEDRHHYTEPYLQDRLLVMLGGRAAESIIFNHVSNGAADDLAQATKLARKMVGQWGMSKQIGPVSFPQSEAHPFLGRDIIESRDFSEETLKRIDSEVIELIHESDVKSKRLIEQHLSQLNALAEALLEQESLDELALHALLKPVQSAAVASVKD